jgi:hypothetical protein
MKRFFHLLLLYVPIAIASDEANLKAADIMLRCASAYGWVMKHTNDNEKRAVAEKWLHTFFNAAQSLTDKEYALNGLTGHATELNERLYQDPLDAKGLLSREFSYCQNIERTEPQVTETIKKLLQRKSKH